MSVLSMTAAQLVREVPSVGAPQVGPNLAAGPPEAERKEDTLTQLLRYTPTEVVGLYIAVVSVLPALPDEGVTEVCESSFTWRWVLFALFAVATPFAVVAASKVQAVRAKTTFAWPVFEMVVATLAFAAWAVALPASPFFDFCSWEGWMGAVVGIVVVLGIGIAAKLAGKALPRS
jgi:uncharacterized membrane protein